MNAFLPRRTAALAASALSGCSKASKTSPMIRCTLRTAGLKPAGPCRDELKLDPSIAAAWLLHVR